jgi:hypothetical protein
MNCKDFTHVVDKAETGSAGVEVTATPVTPAETRNDGRDTKGNAEDQPQVPAMLPADNLIAGQIRDVGNTRLATRLEDHPA